MVMRLKSTQEVVVIGAGVTGLTIALRLQQAGHQVLIIADDFPAPFETIDSRSQMNYTSPWGGAHCGWGKDLPRKDSPAEDWRDHGFALKTFAQMRRLHDEYSDSGITFTKGINLYDDPPDKIKSLSVETATKLGIEGFAFVAADKLPEGVQLGYSYRTWIVNPMVYCSFLLRRFTMAGGRIRKQRVRTPEEIFAASEFKGVKTVVNASGIGFGDADVFIIRGQTCLVANDCDVTLSRNNADGTSSFCIPRKYSGGTVIGGTFEPNNWDPEPAPGQRERLLHGLAKTYPQILGDSGHFNPIRDIVGRRPARKGGMRIEKEDLDHMRAIVHAYGAGGRGYELSWGVADDVTDLIEKE